MDSNEGKRSITRAVEDAQEALGRAYMDARRQAEGQGAHIDDDLVRSYLDQRSALVRTCRAAWDDSIQAGLRMTFDLQNAGLRTWHALFDAALLANRAWLDQAAGSFKIGQDLAARLSPSSS